MTPIQLGMVLLPAGVAGGWPTALCAFLFGTCIGSFLNVCIHRIPADESVVRPASRCPGCGTPIGWYDNVPLLSWAWLRAHCRRCGTHISARYPLVEATTGGLALLALARFGLTPWAAVVFAFAAALVLITFIDLDHQFIPDEVSLPGIAVGLATSFVAGGVGPVDALLGAALGGGLLWVVAWGYERATGVEGMGFGDVKLLAMIGAFVGWQAIPGIILVASITGSLAGFGVMLAAGVSAGSRRVVRRFGVGALPSFVRRRARRTAIPFGPFLAAGALVAIYFPLAIRV